MCLYVDDILVTGSSDKHIQKVKNFLNKQYIIKDLGKARYFLRIEIARNTKFYTHLQEKIHSGFTE